MDGIVNYLESCVKDLTEREKAYRAITNPSEPQKSDQRIDTQQLQSLKDNIMKLIKEKASFKQHDAIAFHLLTQMKSLKFVKEL